MLLSNTSLKQAGYSRIAVQGHAALGQVEHKVVDGDHHLVHLGVAVHLVPLNVHRELLVGLVAVGHQVVAAQPGELVHVTVERLEVVPAPCAADAVDVVQSCGGQVRGISWFSKSEESMISKMFISL